MSTAPLSVDVRSGVERTAREAGKIGVRTIKEDLERGLTVLLGPSFM